MRNWLVVLALAALLGGCAARHSVAPAIPQTVSSPSSELSSATVSITIPQGPQLNGAARRAEYISTATNSMSLGPQGEVPVVMPLTTTTPGCRTLSGARICTLRVSLPTGTYAMRVALYGTPDGTGPPLASVTTMQTITPYVTNTLDFTLNAVVALVNVLVLPDGSFTSGVPGTRTVNVGVFDAAGGVIVVGSDALVDKTGSPVTIVLTNTDTSGSTVVAPTAVGATASQLSYNGGPANGGNVVATARDASGNVVASNQAAFSVSSSRPICTSGRRTASAQCLAGPFLSFPLHCGSRLVNGACPDHPYSGPYTVLSMNSVLDHSMIPNPNITDGAGNYLYEVGICETGSYPHCTGGGDGRIIAFNGEDVHGTPDTDRRCIGGTLYLIPDIPLTSALPMVNSSGCGPSHASYDDHPGYDYYAATGSEVFAAGSGRIVNNPSMCVSTNVIGGCAAKGYVGIDHGNGYITQYGHLSSIESYVQPGKPISEGTRIGLSGWTGLSGSASAHLHFEVLAQIPNPPHPADPYSEYNWAVVDPYGWVGGMVDTRCANGDPLYSCTVYKIASQKLWK